MSGNICQVKRTHGSSRHTEQRWAVTLPNSKASLKAVGACVFTQVAGGHSPGCMYGLLCTVFFIHQNQAQSSRGMSLKSGKCAFWTPHSALSTCLLLSISPSLSLSLSHLYSNHVFSFLNRRIQQPEHQLVTLPTTLLRLWFQATYRVL